MIRPEGRPVWLARARVDGLHSWVAAPTGPARRRPLAVLVPGLLDHPARHAGWLAELAGQGLVAVAPSPAFGADEPGFRARLAQRFLPALDGAVQQTVERIGGVIRACCGFRGADGSRVVLIGVSAGGWAALRAALEAPGVVAVACVLSGPGWERPPAEVEPALRAELGTGGLSLEHEQPFEQDRYPGLHAEAVLERAGSLAGRALLLVQGGQDSWVPAEPSRRLYERLHGMGPEKPERVQLVVYPGLGHRLTAPMQQRVTSWVSWMLAS